MMERDFTRDSDPVTYLVTFVVKTFGRVSFGFEIEAGDEECGAGINGPVTPAPGGVTLRLKLETDG